MKKVIMAVLVGLLAVALSGCFTSTKEQKVKEIVLTTSTGTNITTGTVVNLIASVKDEDGKTMEGQAVTFYSAKKDGATYQTALTLANAQFKPTEVGDYKLYAKIGEVKSNEILVTVTAGAVDVNPTVRLFNEGYNATTVTRPKLILILTGATTIELDCTNGAQFSTAQTIAAGTYKVTWKAILAGTTSTFATNDANVADGNTDKSIYGYATAQAQTLTFAKNKKYEIKYPITGTVAEKKFVATEATY